MELASILDILMFVTACGLLMLGFPVAFTLAGTALLFGLLGMALGVFDFAFLRALAQRIFGVMTNEVLIAVPLFVFMGVVLEKSRVAEELLEEMGALFGAIRGGVGYSVLVVGALMAASTGIVGATVVTMGLISLPTMLRRGYDPKLATGLISAAGTLGQIIPPSIVLILLGDVISNAYQKAQLEAGNFSPDTISVGDLFAGALIPGLGLVALYATYVMIMSFLKPESCPPLPARDPEPLPKVLVRILGALVPPLALIIAVLGSILAGIATPTEAAAVGAVGAILIAGYRLGRQPAAVPVAELQGAAASYAGPGPSSPAGLPPAAPSRPALGSWPVLAAVGSLAGLLLLAGFYDLRIARDEIPVGDQMALYVSYALVALVAFGLLVSLARIRGGGVLSDIMRQTTIITSMVFVIFIGAAVFSLVFRGLGGEEMVHELLSNLPGGTTGAVIVVMAVMFVLGFFLDFIEIVFVVVPLVAPVLLGLGVDPVWLGIMMAVNLQTSFLTPPFGFALFYLRGVAPPTVKTSEIYRGVLPFVFIQIIALVLLATFPQLATWLPDLLFK